MNDFLQKFRGNLNRLRSDDACLRHENLSSAFQMWPVTFSVPNNHSNQRRLLSNQTPRNRFRQNKIYISSTKLDFKLSSLIIVVPYSSHYSEVTIGAMAPQITGVSSVYSTVCSGTDQRKHQSSASLAFVRRVHRGLVNSPHKGQVTRKMFPFDDVIMECVQVLTVIDHSSMRARSKFSIYISYDDVIKWKHIPRYWPFVRGIHRSPVNSPHKGQ